MRKWLRSIAALSLLAIPALLAACSGNDPAPTPAGVVRTYYIAADDVQWDYAPTGINQIYAKPFANYTGVDAGSVFTMTQNVSFAAAPSPPTNTNDSFTLQIGTSYTKSLFREYTSASFAPTGLKAREAKWNHLGFLGPIIRTEVGDTIKVVFKNNTLIGRPFSMHPHGVFYDKASEGAPYAGNPGDPSFSDGNVVPPGGTFTYTWQVPDRAGPGPMDGPSVQWMYHSHVDEITDTYTGLIGPMIIYAKGMLRPDGSVVGIDREFVTMFDVDNENLSWHFANNIINATGISQAQFDAVIAGPPPVSDGGLFLTGFNEEPNLKHNINGFIYGNFDPTLPEFPVPTATNNTLFTMHKGEKVRWYLFSMGTEVDLHTPHWHGNTVLTTDGMRTDVVGLLPATMVTADMVPDNIGVWLFHCHVNDHIAAGMLARYKVLP